MDPGEVLRLHEQERLSPPVIAKRLGIARSLVCRFLPGARASSKADGTKAMAAGPED